MPSLGSPLWLLFNSAKTDAYVAKCLGTVERVKGDSVFVGGRWQVLGYPHFTSEAEANAWIADHPRQIPTAPGT